MIEFRKGDIFTQNTEAIVNPVNCVGVMGKGLALQFKCGFPQNYHSYRIACSRGEVVPGKMFVHSESGKQIINFPTKRDWRNDSRLEDIISGLDDLAKVIRELEIKSITIPRIGCGLGGLDWAVVQSHIVEKLSNLNDVDIIVLE